MDFSQLFVPAVDPTLAVVPFMVGPLQALMAVLPGILVALGGMIVTLFKPATIKRLGLLLWSQKFIVAGIALVIWGLVYLAGVLLPGGSPVVKGDTVANASDSWAIWRGGLDRRAAVGGEKDDPGRGKVVWSFTDGKLNTFMASPAVVGNRVYITAAYPAYFKTQEFGAIYCLAADTGDLVWAYKGDGYRPTYSSPAVWGKYLVVGEGLHETRDARIVCLDREASAREGKGVKLWEFRTNSHVESSPCIADGKLFIGAGDDGTYCFKLEPDAEGKPQMLWQLDPKKFADCETSPVVHDGKVYFGLGEGGHAICCVDANTGNEIWRIAAPYPVFGSPAIAGGKLYVGMGYGNVVQTAEEVAEKAYGRLKSQGKSEKEAREAADRIKPKGEVWCVDLATHEVDWKLEVGRVILGAVAVDGDRIYFGSRDGYVYCASAKEPKLLGKWNARAAIQTSPAVSKELVYVVTGAGNLYGIDKQEMELVWTVSLNKSSFSSPAVARGHVYVGTNGNGLMCVGQPGREPPRPLWPGALGGAGQSGWLDGSLISTAGAYAWGYTGENGENGDNGDGGQKCEPPTAPAAFLDGALYVGVDRKGAKGLARLSCPETLGDKRGPAQVWLAPSKNPVRLSAAGTDEAVFFVDGAAGDASRALHRLDPAGGAETAAYPVGTDASGEFVITRDVVLIAATGRGLTCLDGTMPIEGGELWQADVGPCVGAPLVIDGRAVVAVASPASLVALDLGSGLPLWRTALASAPLTGPVLSADRVWVGTAEGVVGLDPAAGKEVARVACGKVTGRLVADRQRVIAATAAGELVLVDAEKGAETARIAGAAADGLTPVLADKALLYYADTTLWRYDLATAKKELWARIYPSMYGRALTPMIVINSHVFFGTEKKGLVCMKPKKA